jgi:hypothetical protein
MRGGAMPETGGSGLGRIRKGGGDGTAGACQLDLWLFGPRSCEKIIVLPAENLRLITTFHQTPGKIPDTNIKCENPLRFLHLLFF